MHTAKTVITGPGEKDYITISFWHVVLHCLVMKMNCIFWNPFFKISLNECAGVSILDPAHFYRTYSEADCWIIWLLFARWGKVLQAHRRYPGTKAGSDVPVTADLILAGWICAPTEQKRRGKSCSSPLMLMPWTSCTLGSVPVMGHMAKTLMAKDILNGQRCYELPRQCWDAESARKVKLPLSPTQDET